MSIKTPINSGLLQSDLDCAGYDLLNFSGGGGGTGHGIPAGGTTGQLLKKLSATDYDANWATVSGGTNPLITINVKDAPYNAVGNGVADDSVAIQSAINALDALGGGTLFFPKGTYLCNGAYDASTNSILKLPSHNFFSGYFSVPIELRGEVFTGWVDYGSAGGSITAIKTTKAPSGTYPALFAGNPFTAGDNQPVPLFNNVMLRIRNMHFYSPSAVSALRLDSVGWALLENVVAFGGAGNPPATGSVGIWMPKTGNGALESATNVMSTGYDRGFVVGEHFHGWNLIASSSNIGMEFAYANESSHVSSQFLHNIHNIAFTGPHSVDVFADIEYADPAAPDGAMACTADVYDPLNSGGGIFRYNIIKAGTGIVETPALVTGGNKVELVNLHRGDRVIPPSGSITAPVLYIGTDLRLVPISGGGKLQARNTGANTWADVDQWTNP